MMLQCYLYIGSISIDLVLKIWIHDYPIWNSGFKKPLGAEKQLKSQT